MENNIEILENIMRPYFEKRDQIDNTPQTLENNINESKEKKVELKNERIEERKRLEVELENLRVRKQIAIKDFEEKKDTEIEEYISRAINSDSSFYSSYGSMLRKDLERNYDKKLNEIISEFDKEEEDLVDEIKALKMVSDSEKQEAKKISDLEKSYDYKNIDLREMVELKDALRIKLFAERKRLNSELLELKSEKESYENTARELKQQQEELNDVIDKLSNFKFEYNEQNQVINNNEWKVLYEQREAISNKIDDLSHTLSEKMVAMFEYNNVNKALEKLNEYIKLTELTKEEIAAVMRSMTPIEQEEYNRRKGLPTTDLEILKNKVVEKSTIDKDSLTNEDMVSYNDPVVSKYEIEDEKIIVDTKVDLLKAMFNDIISVAKEIRGVRLNESKSELGTQEYYISTKESKDADYEEVGKVNLVDKKPMQLPTGEYLSEEDFKEALENYYNQEKGRTYVVKSTGKEYTISAETISKFKSKLKKCSAIRLLVNDAISKFDITNVFGKVKGEKLFRAADIGTIFKKINMPDGDYINRNELIAKLNNLFDSKKLDWLRKISGKLKETKSENLEEAENVYILNEDEKSFIIKK